MDVRNKLHIEGDGEANILSSFFCVRFSQKNRDKFYICSQALLIIYHEVKEGGGRGRKEEVWGITWFSLLPESIQTGL